MCRVVEDRGQRLARHVAEDQDRQFGVERAGWSNRIVARPRPIDAAVGQHYPAVLSHRLFLTLLEMERRVGQPGVRLDSGLDDAPLDPAAENLVAVVAVYPHCAGCVMRVGAMDQYIGGRYLTLAFDFIYHGIEKVSGYHQDVDCHDRELCLLRLLHHDGQRAKLPFLSLDKSGMDPAGDDHGVIRLEHDGSRTDHKLGGLRDAGR